MSSLLAANVLQGNFEQVMKDSLNIEEIMAIIPHRYPMLMIDRIEKMVFSQSATGIKAVTMNEWFFQGHFPGKPIMPGVLIIEAMAQTAATLVMAGFQKENNDKLVYFMSIEEAKFRKPVLPGDLLELRVQKERSRGNIWKFKGEAWVGDELKDEAIFTAMIVDKK